LQLIEGGSPAPRTDARRTRATPTSAGPNAAYVSGGRSPDLDLPGPRCPHRGHDGLPSAACCPRCAMQVIITIAR
jgi:hypothetical protein